MGSRPGGGGTLCPPHLSQARPRPLAKLLSAGPSSPRPAFHPWTLLQGACPCCYPRDPGQTLTFQVQAVDAVPEVRELLGKQSGRWLRQKDMCRRRAGP